MPRNGELIFAVAIVNVPMARLRLFAPLQRHRSTPFVEIAVRLGLFLLAKPDQERGSA